MSKYYQAYNAGREIAGERFEITSIVGGSAVGVFAAHKPETIAKMDAVVADAKSAVFKITLDEYDDEVKKKAPSLKNFRPSTQVFQPTNLRGPVAVVVDGQPPVDDIESKQLESLEGALSSTAVIEPAGTISEPQPRKSQRK